MTHPAADISQPHLETPAHSAAHSRAPRRTAGQAPLRPPRGPLRPRQLRDTAGGAPAPCLTPSPAQPLYLRSFASEGNAGALEYQPDVRAQQRSAHRPHTEKPTAPHPARTTARYFFLYPPLIELRWKYRENGTNSRTYAFVFSSSPRPPPVFLRKFPPLPGRSQWKGGMEGGGPIAFCPPTHSPPGGGAAPAQSAARRASPHGAGRAAPGVCGEGGSVALATAGAMLWRLRAGVARAEGARSGGCRGSRGRRGPEGPGGAWGERREAEGAGVALSGLPLSRGALRSPSTRPFPVSSFGPRLKAPLLAFPQV